MCFSTSKNVPIKPLTQNTADGYTREVKAQTCLRHSEKNAKDIGKALMYH